MNNENAPSSARLARAIVLTLAATTAGIATHSALAQEGTTDAVGLERLSSQRSDAPSVCRTCPSQ